MRRTIAVHQIPVSLFVFFLVLFFSRRVHVEALSCLPCTAKVCGSLPKCAHSLVPGLCSCCWACAQQVGESCGGYWNMAGVCEAGQKCQPDGLGHVFMRRFRGGPPFQRKLIFPRGVCQGENPKSPCNSYDCPSGSKCKLSWEHCSWQPENASHTCQPVASCVALPRNSSTPASTCVERRVKGCDIFFNKCVCGTKMTCSTDAAGAPSFQHSSAAQCELALMRFTGKSANRKTDPTVDSRRAPSEGGGVLHLLSHNRQGGKKSVEDIPPESTAAAAPAAAGKTAASVVNDETKSTFTSSWLIAVIIIGLLAVLGFFVAVICRRRNRRQEIDAQPKHAYVYSCIPASRPRAKDSIVRVGEQTPSGGMAHVQRLLDSTSDSSSYTKP